MRTLFLTFLFLVALPAYAAGGFALSATETGSGTYMVDVYAASTPKPINAVEGTLTFPPTVRVLNISTGGSVVGFWVEQPIADNENVRFSGIFPGGFTHVVGGTRGGDGLLFSVEVADVNEATLTDGAVFLNDGEGTRVSESPLSISFQNAEQGVIEPVDTTLPEWVLAERVRADDIEEGREMLVISAYDRETGVSHFEVRESGGEWKRTQTPYLIESDSYFNHIDVRAYDYAGNIQEVGVPSHFERTILTLLPFVIGIVLLGILLVYLRKRARRPL